MTLNYKSFYQYKNIESDRPGEFYHSKIFNQWGKMTSLAGWISLRC